MGGTLRPPLRSGVAGARACIPALVVLAGCAHAPPPTAAPIPPPAAAAPAPAAATDAAGRRVVDSRPGMFGTVFVVDEGGTRTLRFGAADGDDQSMITLADRDAVPMEYVRYAALGLVFAQVHERALMIGLGGGTWSSMLLGHVPEVRVDAVEIDPAVVAMAKRHFGVVESHRMSVHVGDGRAFLERQEREGAHRYDLILVDAFSGAGIPAHLREPAFFTLVRARVAPGGVAVANVALENPVEEQAVVAAFMDAFPHHACAVTPESGNVLLFGTEAAPPPAAVLAERAALLDRALRFPFRLAELVARLHEDCVHL